MKLRKPSPRSQRALAAAFAAFSLIGCSSAFADETWTGATGAEWTTGSNWSNSIAPTTTDNLTIAGPGGVAGTALAIDINAAAFANSLIFTNTATTTLENISSGSNQTLTLTSGNITTGTGAVVIGSSTANQNVNLIFGNTSAGATGTWNIGTGGLTVYGNISDGVTSDAITKTGSGTLTLSGTDTYSGATTISAGTVVYQGASSMSSSSALSLASGSTLSLQADANTTFAPASFAVSATNGTYNIAVGSISGTGTNNTLSIMAPSVTTVGNYATTLNITGTAGQNYTLEFTSTLGVYTSNGGAWSSSKNDIVTLTNANLILNAGMATGSGTDGGITLNSTTGNTLTINGNVTTNSGRTISLVVDSGTLILNNGTNWVNTGSGVGSNNGITASLNGGTLDINSATAIQLFAPNGGAGVGLTIGANTTLPILNNTSGAAITMTTNPTVVINGNFVFGTSSSNSTNNLNLGTGAVLIGKSAANQTVAITLAGSSTLTMGGIIANGNSTNGLILNGNNSGTLALTGANTFSGGVTINGGTLSAGNASALGTGAVTISGGALTASVNLTGLTGFTMSSGTWNVSLGSSSVSTGGITGTGTFSITGGTLALSGSSIDYSTTYTILSGLTGSASGLTITGYDTTDYTASINSSGQLQFTASAIPEPATYAALAGLAALGLAFWRRRRA